MTVSRALVSLSLISLVSMAGAAPREVPESPAGVPGAGEIRLDGVVQKVDTAKKLIVFSVRSFSLPDGKSRTLPKPKPKTVVVEMSTEFFTGAKKSTTLAALKKGMAVTVVGTDAGTGKAITARVVLAAGAKGSAGKPATAKGSAPKTAVPKFNPGDTVNALAFSPDGATLVAGCENGGVKIWNSRSANLLHELQRTDLHVKSLALVGKNLVTGGSGKAVLLWDLATEKARELPAQQGALLPLCVAATPDGKLVAAGGVDGTLHLWDVATGSYLRSFKGHATAIRSIAFSRDGKKLASASQDRSVRTWNVETGEMLQMVPGNEKVGAVAFSPDGKTLAVGYASRVVKLWDVETNELRQTMDGHQSLILAVAFSPDGKTLASCSYDRTVHLWDVATGASQRVLEGHKDGVLAIAFSPDGKKLASGGMDRSIRIWDLTAAPKAVPAVKKDGE